MSENQERHKKPDTPNIDEGAPKQALSGGGFEHAGSAQGGSAPGDEREDPKHPEGGFKASTTEETAPSTTPAEEKTFASPDGQEGGREASTESVNNTGEPRPVKNAEGVEGQPGDDVGAATG